MGGLAQFVFGSTPTRLPVAARGVPLESTQIFLINSFFSHTLYIHTAICTILKFASTALQLCTSPSHLSSPVSSYCMRFDLIQPPRTKLDPITSTFPLRFVHSHNQPFSTHKLHMFEPLQDLLKYSVAHFFCHRGSVPHFLMPPLIHPSLPARTP